MAEMVLTAQRPTVEVAASGAPFEAKDLLKARRYRWNDKARVWACEVAQTELDAELAWLAEHAKCSRPTTRRITWFERHRT